jgi:PAS domain S-box-containing protein
MIRFLSWIKKRLTGVVLLRYGTALSAVAAAFLVIFLLDSIHVRAPFASILLLAIASSLLRGGIGPGILAIALSTVALQFFIHTPGGWRHIAAHDLPFFCVFLAIAIEIILFTRKVAANKTEQAQLNTKLETLLSAIPVGVALVGPNRIVLSCNRAYDEMLGFEPGEVIGHAAPLPEKETDIWKALELRLRAGVPILDYETTRIRKDGSQFDATITAIPLFDDDGAYTGLVGVIVDNTQRNRQHAKMRMLTAMAQHSPFIFAVATMDGKAVFVNPRGQRSFGLKDDEHVRHTNVYEYFAESERGRAREHLIPALATLKQLKFETIGRNFETGAEFDLDCSCFVIPGTGTGEPDYIAAIAQDITERRRADARLRMFFAAVQNSPQTIGFADLNLRLISINPAGQTKLGFERKDVTQHNVLELFPEEVRVHVKDELIPLLLQNKQLSRELPSRNVETGVTFLGLWTAFVVDDPETNSPPILAAAVEDISDRRQIEEEMRRRDAYLAEGQRLSHTGTLAWHTVTGATFWSEELFRILGLDVGSVRPSLSAYLDRVHPDDRPNVDRVVNQALEEMRDVEHEYRIVLPDGTVKYINTRGHPSLTAAGELQLTVAAMDVTRQHEDRLALEKTTAEREELRAADAARREQHLLEMARALQDEFATVQRKNFPQIIGESPALQRTLVSVQRATNSDVSVLITGETGVGKDLIAQAIHQNSKRSAKPMITVDCGALMGTPIATALFGYEKGAYTGAEERRPGRFEVAEGTTIFFDEIGEMPLDAQATLLGVLERRVVQRVGGSTPIPVDVRVIAATNRDLEAAVAAGTFRQDLYFRLNHFRIRVPALRERKEDIPALIHHFTRLAADRYEKKIRSIAGQTMKILGSYDWPGNIRELQHVIDVAVMACHGDILAIDEETFSQQSPVPTTIAGSLHEEVANYERRVIERALAECRGRIRGPLGAAVKLNTPPNTLDDRIKALKIDKLKFMQK